MSGKVYKVCRKCEINKPLDKYSKNKLCKDKHQNYCKDCMNQIVLLKYVEHSKSWTCEHCNMTMNDSKLLKDSHLNSKKHKLIIENLNKETDDEIFYECNDINIIL